MYKAISKQSGVILLESLIAVLIFSLGVLALVGLQGSAMKRVGDAKYRFDAAFLANDLIGTMWATRGAANANLSNYDCADDCSVPNANAAMQSWLQRVQDTLPGVNVSAADSLNLPIVQVSNNPGAGNQVRITISWQVADARGGAPVVGVYSTTAYIN